LSIKEFVSEAKEVFENVIAMKDGEFVDLERRK